MTPNEVSGLQAVAKAHGGSLTINPHTGLAEAGFLRGILPTLLGAGLAATGVGAPLAALMVGGGYTVASGGDLKKGLMAGLGAYGGAGMYGAVNPATAAVPTAPTVPTNTLGTGTYPTAPDLTTSVTSGQPLGVPAAPTPTPTPVGAPTPAPASSLLGAPQGIPIQDAVMSKYGAASLGSTVAGSQEEPKAPDPADPGMIRPYTFDRVRNEDAFLNTAGGKPLSSKEQRYFTDTYTAQTPYKAPGPEYMAAGGPVETMSNQAAMGANTMYPMANMATSSFATPYQSPVSTNMLAPTSDSGVTMNGEPSMQGTRMAGGGEVPRFGLGGMSIDPQNASEGGIFALLRQAMGAARQKQSDPRQYTYDPQSQQYTEVQQGTAAPALAMGGSLGGYSDGGRMLKGPGDGMSDNIPAVIGKKQPARLADGEFVVPADVVSHLGNGSTDAGAKQLYAMMDKIRAARTGTKKQGKQINPRKYMPA
jgi:hypothetical protein